MMKQNDLGSLISANCIAKKDIATLRKTIDTFNGGYESNLIYIYGPSGSGKTFLLNGIYQAMAGGGIHNRVLRYRAPDFALELIEAIRQNTCLEFRMNIDKADALLIDDVDKFAHKCATQEEFEQIFNRFWENKSKLMIVTGSSSPDTLELTERLRNRLSWGKVIELKNTLTEEKG